MLLSQTVEIKMGGTNIKYYKSIGYKVKLYETISVNVSELQIESHCLVDVSCDYCEKVVQKQYRNLLREREKSIIKKDCCVNCIHTKDVETNLFLYGVENPMNRIEIREKFKENFLKKYGVENPTQDPEINLRARESQKNISKEQKQKKHDQIIKTNLEKYGYEYYNQSPEGQERFKKTCLEKYGFENPNQNEEVRKKTKETNIEKYGAENYFASDVFKDYIKKYWLEKDGVDHYSKTEDFQKKIQLFWNNISKQELKEIIEKRYATLISRYGTASMFIITKDGYTLANGIKTSSQQLKIYEYLIERYTDWEISINQLIGSSFYLDILMHKDEIDIDVEYDGYFWHIQERDERRNEYIKSLGWKIFRIKSGYKIPDKEYLYKELDILISNNNYYAEIILDDWEKRINLIDWRQNECLLDIAAKK